MGRFLLLNTGKEQEAGGTPSYALHRFVAPGLALCCSSASHMWPVSFRQPTRWSVRLHRHALAISASMTITHNGYIMYPFREIKRAAARGAVIECAGRGSLRDMAANSSPALPLAHS